MLEQVTHGRTTAWIHLNLVDPGCVFLEGTLPLPPILRFCPQVLLGKLPRILINMGILMAIP